MTLSYVLRRLLLAIPTLFGVALFTFVVLRLVPGDPIAMMVVGEATPQDIARLREEYGLDKPIAQQFAIYVGDLLRGNFGTSISFRQDVLEIVLRRLPATLELAAFALGIALALGVALALIGTFWRHARLSAAIDGFNSIALAIPEFLWALLLVIAFGVLLPWFPISGRLDPVQAVPFATGFYLFESVATGNWSTAADLLRHLALPAIALALPLAAVISRILKSSLLEALVQDYILLARVKGFSPPTVLVRHALPNAVIPTISVTGVHFVFLVGGTVLVELIFAYPGIGNLLYTAAINRDLPLIQGVTIVFALLFTVLNLLIDLSYGLVNPRIRQR
ncbi:MAG TPA: ABC transporter permease [Burkholderiaceae bacterium]|nr:ABC transporter permease [Burkholderiaceae bacterium]